MELILWRHADAEPGDPDLARRLTSKGQKQAERMAAWLGPRLSGAITPFPIATTILLAFTHAQQGAPAAVGFLRAFLPAMWSFALFCFVLAWGVVGLGRDLAFLLALALSLGAQGLVWLGLEALASRETVRRGPRAARRSA